MMQDLISRQAAIEAIHEDADWLAAQGSDWQVERMERDKSILKSLPSAEPEQLEKCPIYGGVCLHPSDQCYECPRHAGAERKKGHWVEIGDEPYDEWECDMCGFVIDGSGCIDPEEYKDVYNFCPNCGAKMER
jgi:hypothetical protein